MIRQTDSIHTLELLAPAKNLECGMAAIDHGADAVYVGAAHHGARASAGNSVEDIAALCAYAHRYGARVHATLNTIVYDDEMDDVLRLADQLAAAGVDAFLVQDMGLMRKLRQRLPQVALHASTQCDTRTAEKVAWLRSLGFDRVVLARELSLDEIRTISEANHGVELEAFVHGALCVSYSGVCYASQQCFHRSANRGECAQFCRLPFDLVDSDGQEIASQRHLLSLKDMCRINGLEALAEAGVCSFKIEGRLKDADYVKNVVAAYSQALDRIIKNNPNKYRRASFGKVRYTFEPDLRKTFNRGYTAYFLNGREPDIVSMDTPKALGESVGRVKEVRRESLTVAGTASFANGDGLCFLTADRRLVGFRVNRAEGNRLFPHQMPEGLKPGMSLYRNHDERFEKLLSGKTATRSIEVSMVYGLTPTGFYLTMTSEGPDCNACTATAETDCPHDAARRPQDENVVRQLTKLGDTPYACDKVDIRDNAGAYFVPNSRLADLRREVVSRFEEAWMEAIKGQGSGSDRKNYSVNRDYSVYKDNRDQGSNPQRPKNLTWEPAYGRFPYLYNISNHLARAFYEHQGMANPTPAFEMARPEGEVLIMQCRHCIRYALGHCVRRGGTRPSWREPLFLRLADGRRFRLEFRCDECQMEIYANPK